MVIFIAILVPVVVFTLTIEVVEYFVRGPYIRDKYLLPFLESKLPQYEINEFSSSKMFHGGPNLPYISKSTLSVFSSWNIEDIGRVPFWSKGNKMIKNRWKELPKPKPATLSDYL